MMDREPLLPITVRFAPDAYEAIREIASANGTSQAEIVRMAVAGNLVRYLGDIRYIDPEQGEEVKRRVAQLIDAVSGIRNELNRIGVNLNQIARWMNTLAKYGNGDVGDGETGDGEVEYGSVFLTGIKLDMLMYRYKGGGGDMPYTRVTRTAYGADAIAYLRGHGHGHNGVMERNLYVGEVRMLPDSAIPFEQQMQHSWDRADPRHKIQLDRYVISFHPDELDPENPEDCLKALEIGYEFAKTIAPHSQAAVFVQRDGKGGKLHVHAAINDVRSDNYKAIHSSAYFFWHFAPIANEICTRYFDLKVSEPASERVTQAVRAKRMENDLIQRENDEELLLAAKEGREPKLRNPIYIWKDDLRSRIRRAADGAADEDDFARRLRQDGVELVPRVGKDGKLDYKRPATKTHPEHYTYELTDLSGFDGKPPAKLKARSYKLGADFQPDAVAKLFQPRAKAAQAAQESAIHLPKVPSGKPAKTPEKAKVKVPEKPKPKQDSQAMEQARWLAIRIAWPVYSRFMGWEVIDFKDLDGREELEQRNFMFFDDWNRFRRWRAGRPDELEPIFMEDKSTGTVTVNESALLKQFGDYLGLLSAEKRRKEAGKQYDAMTAEWERAGNDGMDGKDGR